MLDPFLRGCFWPPRGGPFLWRKRLSPLRCPHTCLKGEQNALFLFHGKRTSSSLIRRSYFMKSTKTMLFGTIIVLLGIGLIQSGNDLYLAQTFPFLAGNIMTTVFPLASLILVLLGALLGIVGIFVRK